MINEHTSNSSQHEPMPRGGRGDGAETAGRADAAVPLWVWLYKWCMKKPKQQNESELHVCHKWAEVERGCGNKLSVLGGVCVSVCVLESSLYALPALLVSVLFVYIWQTCNAPLGRGTSRSEDMVGVAALCVAASSAGKVFFLLLLKLELLKFT